MSNPDQSRNKVQGEFTGRSGPEQGVDEALLSFAKRNIGRQGPQWNYHSIAFLKRQVLSRILYLDQIYRMIVDVPGVICEFGVQWGATMATLANLRGMYEPFNHSRTIVGFDTFSGFPQVDEKDGGHSQAGDYSVATNYQEELDHLLGLHEQLSPIPHLKKFQLVKGDVTETFGGWLVDNSHAIIALAIFDMDIYTPTKDVLNRIEPRLTKGSVLVFDELNCPYFPGETQAVIETLGLGNLRLRRHRHQPFCAWAVWGD
jgi:Macrocin-O-methyltransferase (TylF)